MQPGDHVILVDDDWSKSRNRHIQFRLIPLPVRGVVYTVCHAAMRGDELHIGLAELPLVPRQKRCTGFFAHRFRKLSRLTPEHFALTKEKING